MHHRLNTFKRKTVKQSRASILYSGHTVLLLFWYIVWFANLYNNKRVNVFVNFSCLWDMTKHDFFIQFFFSSIAKQATFAYVNYAPIGSWNQPVLSDEGKVSCSRKQREPKIDGARSHDWQASTNRVRRASHCATPPLNLF